MLGVLPMAGIDTMGLFAAAPPEARATALTLLFVVSAAALMISVFYLHSVFLGDVDRQLRLKGMFFGLTFAAVSCTAIPYATKLLDYLLGGMLASSDLLMNTASAIVILPTAFAIGYKTYEVIDAVCQACRDSRSNDHNMATAAEIRSLIPANPDIADSLELLARGLDVLEAAANGWVFAERRNGRARVNEKWIRAILKDARFSGADIDFIVNQIWTHERTEGHAKAIQEQLTAMRMAGENPYATTPTSYPQFSTTQLLAATTLVGAVLAGVQATALPLGGYFIVMPLSLPLAFLR